MQTFLPQSVISLRSYNRGQFLADLGAGITVGLVALPLAMAFAISSGLPPQAGIYTAIFAGFVTSLLGGSTTAIGGPTGAFVVVVAGIVSQHGINGLLVCTLMAGGILVALGATGVGSAIKYIPRPVVVGFTNGIAILIASTQIRDLLGLQVPSLPDDFVGRMRVLAAHLDSVSPAAVAIAAVTLAIVLLTPRMSRRFPGTILAMIGVTLVVSLAHISVETIGTRFGGIPSGLPRFAFPTVSPSVLPELIPAALTVAMLGAIESLLAATVADRMTGTRHSPNMELIGQGVANIISPLTGGLPATGAIARTATNIRSGARTPVAGMIHSIVLLAILLFAAPLAARVPLAALSAMLLVVAYNMGEWHQIPELLKLTKADILVWLTTMTLTVVADLTIAVEVGMVLAALLFIRRVGETTSVARVTSELIEAGERHSLQGIALPWYVAIFRIHGPFLFGTTDKLSEIADNLKDLPPIVVIRLRHVPAMDASGLQAIQDLADQVKASGRTLIVCGARDQPAHLMERAEFHEHVGDRNICDNVQAALQRAHEIAVERSVVQAAG